MYKCFVEYQIGEPHRDQYLKWIAEKRESIAELLLYEGTDQAGLFVEIWEAESEEEAEKIKKERCSERSPWFEVSQWVQGGPAKIHAWVFRLV